MTRQPLQTARYKQPPRRHPQHSADSHPSDSHYAYPDLARTAFSCGSLYCDPPRPHWLRTPAAPTLLHASLLLCSGLAQTLAAEAFPHLPSPPRPASARHRTAPFSLLHRSSIRLTANEPLYISSCTRASCIIKNTFVYLVIHIRLYTAYYMQFIKDLYTICI